MSTGASVSLLPGKERVRRWRDPVEIIQTVIALVTVLVIDYAAIVLTREVEGHRHEAMHHVGLPIDHDATIAGGIRLWITTSVVVVTKTPLVGHAVIALLHFLFDLSWKVQPHLWVNRRAMRFALHVTSEEN